MCRTPEERIERVASLLPKGISNDERKESAEELDILMDKHLEIFPQELENSFEAGFKTGAKLMCEIFSEEAETIKRYGSFRDQ